jgi:DNA-directed RNA polymerase subunit omega
VRPAFFLKTIGEESVLNWKYLENAKGNVPNTEVLVNLISRRIRQLYNGARPLVKPDTPNMDPQDIALKEIAEGKLTAEMIFTEQGGGDEPQLDELAITL